MKWKVYKIDMNGDILPETTPTTLIDAFHSNERNVISFIEKGQFRKRHANKIQINTIIISQDTMAQKSES